MDREFLDFYNRELGLLFEHARDFAEDYPGIAERLGGLVAERMDPMVGGLLEGAAFLAARVQLKLKHEFPEFTANLLEQLVPHYLAPTPSAMLVRIAPPYGDPALREGQTIARGAYLDATYRERDRQIACRFRLVSDIVLWPFAIAAADYFPSAAALHALGVPVASTTLAGLRITLAHRLAPRVEDEEALLPTAGPDTMMAGCRTDDLTFHLVGAEADAVALYEQIFANRVGVHFRYLDSFGDPVTIAAPPNCVEQIGFAEADSLLGNDNRLFAGFDLLREYFVFARKFLGFRLTNLRRIFDRVPARQLEIIFAFDELNGRLAASTKAESLSLYAAPAINLFEKSCDRILLKDNQHEFHIVPDRSRYLDFEPNRLLSVFAHSTGRSDRVPIRPLYSATNDNGFAEPETGYTVRRLARRRGAEERRYGLPSDYVGTDMFVSLAEAGKLDDDHPFAELSIRALCSNRHLAEHLPLGQGGADFRLLDNVDLDLHCIAGPTPPREPVVSAIRTRGEVAHAGTVAWRLINILSLNHLGLVERGGGGNAQALREILTIFGDFSESALERRIRGVRQIDSEPVVRRIRQKGGVGAARGTQITVTLDEKAFEGSGAFLLGAILDRFFCEYAGFNHFTETVIRSQERGEIMRWPTRTGVRRVL